MHEPKMINSSGNKDEKTPNCEHFKFQKNEIIAEKYKVIHIFLCSLYNVLKILTHIADGTFGRLVKVRSLIDHKIYAMKVILQKYKKIGLHVIAFNFF